MHFQEWTWVQLQFDMLKIRWTSFNSTLTSSYDELAGQHQLKTEWGKGTDKGRHEENYIQCGI